MIHGASGKQGIKALAERAPNPHFRNIRRLHCLMFDTSSGTAGLIESLNIISPSSLLRILMRASPYSANLESKRCFTSAAGRSFVCE
jgi:hypothetical protein